MKVNRMTQFMTTVTSEKKAHEIEELLKREERFIITCKAYNKFWIFYYTTTTK